MATNGGKRLLLISKQLIPDLKIKEHAGPKINDQNKPRWIGGNPPDFVYIDGPGLNRPPNGRGWPTGGFDGLAEGCQKH